jgi:hypothetical protein
VLLAVVDGFSRRRQSRRERSSVVGSEALATTGAEAVTPV